VDSCTVDVSGTWTIYVTEYNMSNQAIGSNSKSFPVAIAPEFGKFGAFVPLFATGFLYMNLRKKILKK
jgi:hypothetical protein